MSLTSQHFFSTKNWSHSAVRRLTFLNTFQYLAKIITFLKGVFYVKVIYEMVKIVESKLPYIKIRSDTPKIYFCFVLINKLKNIDYISILF